MPFIFMAVSSYQTVHRKEKAAKIQGRREVFLFWKVKKPLKLQEKKDSRCDL